MADESVGKIYLDLGINQNGLSRELNGLGTSLKSQIGKIGAMAAAAFSAKKIFDFGKQAVEIASDLDEVQNVVDTAFGNMSYKMEQFADVAIKQFGISQLSAKRTGSTFMAMAKGMDLPAESASNMALQLTGLSADIASFYNISQELAETKLKSVFTGETETLKDLGIVMTQANLQAFALSKGITKNIQDMSQAEQVQLRYAFVMKQTELAQGDFSKTSGSWANQTRILSESWKEFLGTLGVGIKNVLTPLIQWLNVAMQKVIQTTNVIKSVINSMRGISDSENENAKSGAAMSDSLSDIGTSADKTAKKIKKSLMGFDELNILTQNTAENSDEVSNSLGNIPAPDLMSIDLSDRGTTSLELPSDEIEKQLSNIVKAIEPTIDSLKRLWNEGLSKLGKFSCENLKLFYADVLKPIGKWVLGEGLPRFFNILNDGIKNMKLERLNKSFDKFYKQISRFSIGIFKGLLEFVDKFLKPVSEWTVNVAIPSFLDSLSAAMARVDFTIINDALSRLFSNLANFTIETGGGLLYILNNVLVPLAAWSISELLPAFLNTLSEIFSVLTEVCAALAPTAEKIFEVFLRPIAEWTGGVIIEVLEILTDLFHGISDWIKNNQEKFVVMTELVLAFFAAWKAKQLLSDSKIIEDAIKGVILVVTNFKTALNNLLTPTNLLIAGFATLAVGILELIKNWDKMSGLSRAVTVFGAVAAAATAAAIAVAVFHTSWSVGVAAATIAAGIALIIGTQASIKKATDSNEYMSVPMMAKGGIVTQPTLAMVGERGREAVMPLENNTGWIDELAGKLSLLINNSNVGNNTSNTGTANVVLELNGTELGRVIVDTVKSYQRQVGAVVL